MQLIEKNNESIFKQYLPVIAVFLFVASMVVYEIFQIGTPTEYMVKNSFSGIITSKYVSKSWVYVGLENKENKQQIENGYNYSYDIPDLIDFIKVGDKVNKNSCSDTVYIERSGKQYHFIPLAYWYNDSSKSKEFKQKYMAKRLIRLYEGGGNVDSLALKMAISLVKQGNDNAE